MFASSDLGGKTAAIKSQQSDRQSSLVHAVDVSPDRAEVGIFCRSSKSYIPQILNIAAGLFNEVGHSRLSRISG